MNILTQVASGILPRESGIQTLISVFGLSKEQAESLVPPQASADVSDPEAAKAVADIVS